MVRTKIQASQIINRLTNCVMGSVEMSPQQVAAARILLDKSLPNLQSTDIKSEDKRVTIIVRNDTGDER